MLEIRGLSKTYNRGKKGETRALDDVSFTVKPGEVLALLGPNGAGKTTCFRLIAGLLRPDAGGVLVGRRDGFGEAGLTRRMVGYLPAEAGTYARLTPRETVRFFGAINGLSGSALESRVSGLMSTFGVTEFADRRQGRLSTGMKQKVALARTLVHDPSVLVLDEPTAGLDLPASRTVEEFIRREAERGKAVLVSTHSMEEAEFVADRVVVLSGGRVAASGTPGELKQLTGAATLRGVFLSLVER